jgi:hypothetical protein
MDSMLSDRADMTYSDKPPVLIIGTSDAASARARQTILASGLRISEAGRIDQAQERIGRQASAAAIWIEVDEDAGGAMDALLAQVGREADEGRYAAIVSGTSALLDPLTASVGGSSVELIVDADEAQRVAALAVATSRCAIPLRLSDVAADKNAERLRQLSDEVSRIATTLARLSTGPTAPSHAIEPARSADVAEVSADTVRTVIRARRLRARYFPEELFADPAWDMLLDLLQAEIAHLRVPVSSLCIAAAVPATTALRWLKAMVSQGIFVRRADPHDGRRVFVELAPEASQALRRYFADVGQAAVI